MHYRYYLCFIHDMLLLASCYALPGLPSDSAQLCTEGALIGDGWMGVLFTDCIFLLSGWYFRVRSTSFYTSSWLV